MKEAASTAATQVRKELERKRAHSIQRKTRTDITASLKEVDHTAVVSQRTEALKQRRQAANEKTEDKSSKWQLNEAIFSMMEQGTEKAEENGSEVAERKQQLQSLRKTTQRQLQSLRKATEMGGVPQTPLVTSLAAKDRKLRQRAALGDIGKGGTEGMIAKKPQAKTSEEQNAAKEASLLPDQVESRRPKWARIAVGFGKTKSDGAARIGDLHGSGKLGEASSSKRQLLSDDGPASTRQLLSDAEGKLGEMSRRPRPVRKENLSGGAPRTSAKRTSRQRIALGMNLRAPQTRRTNP
jgi:hypothetical protein